MAHLAKCIKRSLRDHSYHGCSQTDSTAISWVPRLVAALTSLADRQQEHPVAFCLLRW